MADSNAITPSPERLPTQDRHAQPSWDDIGEGFETLGKVGLAMAIGFSAAGLFCRLAQQGKVKVPSLSALLVNNNKTNEPSK